MINFFIKPTKIVVDCFTANPAVLKFFPILDARKNHPAWFKNMENHFVQENKNSGIEHKIPTIKRCDGMLHLYSKGFNIPLWSDLIIETNSNGDWRYQYSSDENYPIVSHSRQQTGPSFNDMIHLKLLSPWIISEKTGVKFYFGGSSWNYFDNLFKVHVLPGILNYKDQMSTHINVVVPKTNNRLEMSAGDVLVHCIPLTEKDIELRHHLISEEDFKLKMLTYSYMSSFMGRFKKNAKRN